ncbi:MAG: hypothetical protein E6F96_05795 [Actinobacteria bacterium]|nr:MAG: hypothetical protein E6F96_05795 [Actinomycetota bacterium]
MHAVLLEVDLSGTEREEGLKNLRETVVPRVTQAPGFQSGIWLAPVAGKGLSVVVFEGEENAQAMAAMVAVGSNPSPGVTVERCEVREVVASA